VKGKPKKEKRNRFVENSAFISFLGVGKLGILQQKKEAEVGKL
jgi:hypothetical protein